MKNDGPLGTLIAGLKFFAIVCIVGLFPWALWSIIKIPLWVISPHRGALSTEDTSVMTLSLERTMWTPHSFWIIGWGGFAFILDWTVVYMMFHPEMPIWNDDAETARWLLYVLAVAATINTLYLMILELFMIFSFREWFYWMKEKGRNPLT